MADDAESQEPQPAQEDVQASLKPENVRQMKIAMTTLAACMAGALNETDSQFEQRFVKLLDKAFDNYRNNSDADPQHVLEVIHWTREMLSGWNPVPGSKDSIFGEEKAEPEAADD
jgi:hypothetical protein